MKMVCRVVLLFSLALTLPAQAVDGCIDASNIFGASYVIHRSGDASEQSFVLLRQSPARLIYRLPSAGLTQVYERYSERLVKMIEYFDFESIGVEYEPAPGEKDWAEMYQLISDARLAKLERTGQSLFRCLPVEEYRGTEDGVTLSVAFLPGADLPLRIERARGGSLKTWELRELVTTRDAIEATLARTDRYRSYDFADLGDSENEPFFRRSRYLQYKLGHSHEH